MHRGMYTDTLSKDTYSLYLHVREPCKHCMKRTSRKNIFTASCTEILFSIIKSFVPGFSIPQEKTMLDATSNALLSQSNKLIHDGFYRNRHGIFGYYMVLWHAGHYHMISISNVDDVPTLKSIAKALQSVHAVLVQSGNYRNKRGTLGYWATIRCGNSWYMISISDMQQPFHSQWWIDRLGVA
jgi:hypothetical protein